MNKILILLFLPLLLVACNKDNMDTRFEIPLRVINLQIPVTANSFQVHYFNNDNIPTNSTELFDANNIAVEDATAILPSSGRLSALLNNIDYDFIEQMSIRICDAGDLTENCGTEIFWRQPVPNNVGNILDLVPSDIDIKEYLLQDKINIQVKLERMRENPPQNVDTELTIKFAVR